MTKCILVVDDTPVIRKFIHSYFDSETESTFCGEAADGLDAIEKARDLHPDLIILDASMPRISGFEAAPILRSMDDSVPIILFTIHAEAISDFAASAAGIASVILKTRNISELSDKVESLLRCVG
jgi:DNA-binding response OmpR family regulator